MDEPAAPPPKRRRSWLLIVSLCLNVALIAGIVLVVVRVAHRTAEIGASGGALAPRALMTEVPAERAHIQAAIDAHAAKIRVLRQASLRTRREAWRVLSSPGYTPARMTAALGAVQSADAALETESIAMMNDSLATLTPSERQALVEKVRRRAGSWLFRLLRPREQ
jgi:uncharacterized membrane protein